MAVKIESFLSLEESLSKRLDRSYRKYIAPLLTSVAELSEGGDFDAAYDIVNKIDLSSVIEPHRKYIEVIGVQAALFGARDITSVKKTFLSGAGVPPQIKMGASIVISTLVTSANEEVKKAALLLISKEEVAQKEKTYTKTAADTEFVGAFVSSVSKRGTSFIHLSSSLHTSRLASWGMTTQAFLSGIKVYSISEQLDGRVCPVCREMHGKQFFVEPAMRKLEGLLGVEDPNDLKIQAPWPGQSEEALRNLKSMDTGQLVAAGWDTPPYHPLCRGVLLPVRGASIPAPIATALVGSLETALGAAATANSEELV